MLQRSGPPPQGAHGPGVLARVGAALALAAALLGGAADAQAGSARGPRPAGPTASSAAAPAAAPRPDFALRDAAGKLRRLASYRGKVVVVTFGYVYCPDVCPTTMQILAEAMQDLGPDADRVQVVFVTVDPERDSPAVIGAYAAAFDPRFVGLRGDARATAAAARAFDVDYTKKPRTEPGSEPGSYGIDHTAASYLVDPFGQLRVVIGYGQRAGVIANEIRRILAAMPAG